jgi:PAS domain S-box-containing protein
VNAEHEPQPAGEEELLSDFFENAAVGLHWVDRHGIIIRANRAELALLGYTKDEYIGRPIADFHADAATIEEILTKLGRGETIHSYEARLRCKDGSIRHVLISSNVLWRDGEFVHTRCFTRDITEQKRARDALQLSENLKSAILNAALDAVITMDARGFITDFNPAAEKIFGYPKEMAIGHTVADLIIPARLHAQHWAGLSRYLATGESRVLGTRIEQVAVHADGHEFPVELSILRIEGSTPATFAAMLRDLSDVKHAMTQQARLAAIVASSDDGIVGKTLNGIITSWNRGAERIFGYAADEMIGQSILKLIPEQRHHEEESILRQLRQGGKIEHFETERLHKDGRLLTVSLTSSPIYAPDGTIIGASKIVRDITARKRADEELRRRDEELRSLSEQAAEERERLLKSERAAREESERMSALKDEFLATLSHELRTPLNAILGWAQILRRAHQESDFQRGVDTIERNARMQAQLIEDLLDMSRITSGQVRLDTQAVHLVPIIEAAIETVTPSAKAKSIRVESVLDPAAGPVSGDPARLQQVIWNLLSNAVKFTPKNGKVQVLLARVNSHVEISVADTGAGITPDFLPHVFDRFRQADASTTREYAGLGLGLSIVKSLVELHGGVVRAESDGAGRGATFMVRLPVMVMRTSTNPEQRLHPRTPLVSSPAYILADLTQLKVLVVDDDADARDLIKRILEECGAEVLTAASAMDALSLVPRARPKILVSDIGMPQVDGYELLKRVRALGEAQGGNMNAIALTAFARSEDRARALRAGFINHVSKPVEPSELIASVASAAGRTA